ncbi:MAG: hypothetical protein KGL39_12600 [Patescibacteria group bacterium]|nr:hypothetical protein [Patescibacteria group bacterium]
MQKDHNKLLVQRLHFKKRGEGQTVAELVEQTGMSASTIRNWIREAIKQGRLRLVWKSSVRIDGSNCLVPAYQPVPEKKHAHSSQ